MLRIAPLERPGTPQAEDRLPADVDRRDLFALVVADHIGCGLGPGSQSPIATRKVAADLFQLRARELASRRDRLHVVQTRTVEAQDLGLDLLRQLRVAVPFLNLRRDLERVHRLDQRLRRAARAPTIAPTSDHTAIELAASSETRRRTASREKTQAPRMNPIAMNTP